MTSEESPTYITKANTRPFLFSALLYCAFLGMPFLLFLTLRAVPRPSRPTTEFRPAVVWTFDASAVAQAAPAEKPSANDLDEFKADTNTAPMADTQSEDASSQRTPEESDDSYNTMERYVNNTLPWWRDKESNFFVVLTRLSIFSAVMSFGALGAALSLITRVRSGAVLNEQVTKREVHSIQTVGAVFALMLSLLFMGELVGGSLFPNADTFYYVIYLPAAFAKLLVWSFIAGFSERFVPALLNNLTKKSLERTEDGGKV